MGHAAVTRIGPAMLKPIVFGTVQGSENAPAGFLGTVAMAVE